MSDVPLKEHLETQITWLDRFLNGQIERIKEATQIALAELNVRLAGMNEFRDTLKDQAARLATKDELRGAERESDRRIKSLEMSRSWVIGASVGASTLVSALVGALFLWFGSR